MLAISGLPSLAAQTFEIGGQTSQSTQPVPAKKPKNAGQAAAVPEGNGLGGFGAGIEYVIIYFRNYMQGSQAGLDAVRRFAQEVIPAFRQALDLA